MVAKIDEQQAAMIANAMDPAGNADGLPDIGFAKSGTSVAAVTMHDIILEPRGRAATPKRAAAASKSGGKAHGEADLSRPEQIERRRLSDPAGDPAPPRTLNAIPFSRRHAGVIIDHAKTCALECLEGISA